MSDTTSAPEAVPGTDDTCALCGTTVRPGGFVMLNGHVACRPCAEEVANEVADKQAGAGSVPMAAIGGALGAGLGAAVWAGISIATDFEIGYVAVLVGFLAGMGVKLLSGGAHGTPLQVVAVVFAIVGLVLAKYVIFANAFSEVVLESYDVQVGWFAPETREAFMEFAGEMFGGFDLLWVFLAATAAWRVPGSPQIEMQSE